MDGNSHTRTHRIVKYSECFVTGVTLVGSRSVLVSDLKTSDRHMHQPSFKTVFFDGVCAHCVSN